MGKEGSEFGIYRKIGNGMTDFHQWANSKESFIVIDRVTNYDIIIGGSFGSCKW